MKRLLAGIAFACFASVAQSQEPSKAPPASPDMRQEALRQVLQGSTAATIAQVSDAMIESQLRAAEKPETARRLAIFKKNLVDALVAQGFTRQEAFSIMLVTPPPSASAGTK